MTFDQANQIVASLGRIEKLLTYIVHKDQRTMADQMRYDALVVSNK